MPRFNLIGRDGEYIGIEQLLDWVRAHPLPTGRPIPVCIWGTRGSGKTQRLRQYCKERGLDLLTHHPAQSTTGGDIVGLPYREGDRTLHALPDWLPTESGHGGILFIDEFNRALPEVLNGMMELFGEGSITSSGYRLPDGWSIVVAANPSEMAAQGQVAYTVNQLDEAMIDRFLHYCPGIDAPGWAAWADKTGINSKVVDFALRNPTLIEDEEIGGLPEEIEAALSTSLRSLEYLAWLLPENEDVPPGLLPVIAYGLLGRDASEKFIHHWHDQERPLTFHDIVAGGWESKIERWASGIEESDLIQATNERLVSELVRRDISDPNRAHIARVIGYYLSRIEPHHRKEMLMSVARSAAAWKVPIEKSAEHYLANPQAPFPKQPPAIGPGGQG